MPDEAREMIFPQGLPVEMIQSEAGTSSVTTKAEGSTPPIESDSVSTTAEGGLSSEAEEIESQARQSRTPESGENLLNP